MNYRNFAIEISVPNATKRWWNGSDDLFFNGNNFIGTYNPVDEGAAIGLTAPEIIAGEVGARCRFQIAVTAESVRRTVASDLGPLACQVWWIYLDSSGNWQIEETLTGEMSNVILDPNSMVYAADIEGELGRFGKGRVKYWSHSQQTRDYPGDLCFENLKSLEQGAESLRW